jgi:hypothetical protein
MGVQVHQVTDVVDRMPRELRIGLLTKRGRSTVRALGKVQGITLGYKQSSNTLQRITSSSSKQ